MYFNIDNLNYNLNGISYTKYPLTAAYSDSHIYSYDYLEVPLPLKT